MSEPPQLSICVFLWCFWQKPNLKKKRLWTAKNKEDRIFICFYFLGHVQPFFTPSWFIEKGCLLSPIQYRTENYWLQHLHGGITGDFCVVCARRDAVALHEPWQTEYFYGNCLEISAQLRDIQAAIIAHTRSHTQRHWSQRRRSVCLCNKWLIKSNKFSKINTVIRLCAMGDEASNFRGSSRTGVSSPKDRTGEDRGSAEILG